MDKEKLIECKDCGKLFLVKDDEKWMARQPALDTSRMSSPQRCETCRVEKRKRNAILAQTNFPIQEAGRLVGCFEELTASDLGTLALWGSWEAPSSVQPGGRISEKKKKRRAELPILAPAWIDDAFAGQTQAAQHHWQSIVAPAVSNNPKVIKFSVKGMLTCVAWLRELAQGLTIWWFDYAPWITRYKNAVLSLFSYAILDSIQHGHDGRILVRSTPENQGLLEEVGCQPSQDSRLAELSTENSWRLILSAYGVSERVTDLLLHESPSGKEPLAWIVEKVGRQVLSPEFVEHFTLLAQGVNWMGVRRLAAQRLEKKDTNDEAVHREVRHTIGAVFTSRHFTKLGFNIDFLREIPSLGHTIQSTTERVIECYRVRTATGAAVGTDRRLHPGEQALLISRIWSKSDYGRDEIYQVPSLFAQIGHPASHHILVVTEDFQKLERARQESIIAFLENANIGLYIIPCATSYFQWRTNRLFRWLGPNTNRVDSDAE